MKTKLLLLLVFCFSLLNGCQTIHIQDNHNSQTNLIKTYTLKNGIPVNIQNDEYATSNSILICFNNSITDIPLEHAGIYKTLFDLLKQESKNYSTQNLQRLLYLKNASIDSCSSRDGQYISLTCLTKYFDQLLPIYLDCLLNPNFQSSSNYLLKQQKNLQNEQKKDISLLLANMSKDLSNYSNYFGKTTLTPDSVNIINIELLESYYRNMFSNDNIKIICNGNYNIKKLLSELNKTIGNTTLLKPTKHNAININLTNHSLFSSFDNSIESKVDFAFSILPISNLNEPEFISYYLISLIYSDLLFNITREKYGSCYSIYSDILLLKQPFFCTYGIRITNQDNFFKSIEESKQIILEKKVITGKTENDFIYSPLNTKVESYKNKLINKIYSNKYTSEKKANLLALGLFTASDINYYLNIVHRIENLTYDEISSCIDTLFSDKENWFYLTGEK